jgi:Development and cell death domain
MHSSYIRNIDPGLPLFLFNYSDRHMHGIFEAAGPGGMNIDPYAWSDDGSARTPFPAQVGTEFLFVLALCWHNLSLYRLD